MLLQYNLRKLVSPLKSYNASTLCTSNPERNLVLGLMFENGLLESMQHETVVTCTDVLQDIILVRETAKTRDNWIRWSKKQKRKCKSNMIRLDDLGGLDGVLLHCFIDQHQPILSKALVMKI
ncbi:hypothetical protein M9H77_24967 [Catharanthus roseus]|uniref:Uncharacterized protein n=1 Tax=Catharanthus roseus TaxID=4058 RepID=A0ACC0A7L1_CATRO|nr:hypothetical protein M9H77_24967 [Catharanthus roseus]